MNNISTKTDTHNDLLKWKSLITKEPFNFEWILPSDQLPAYDITIIAERQKKIYVPAAYTKKDDLHNDSHFQLTAAVWDTLTDLNPIVVYYLTHPFFRGVESPSPYVFCAQRTKCTSNDQHMFWHIPQVSEHMSVYNYYLGLCHIHPDLKILKCYEYIKDTGILHDKIEEMNSTFYANLKARYMPHEMTAGEWAMLMNT
jgi:hypothetical protein